MDVEGAEFAILRQMIEDSSVSKLNVLYIEWHHRHLCSESRRTTAQLRRAIESHGVTVIDLD
jgi:hypothetical protein